MKRTDTLFPQRVLCEQVSQIPSLWFEYRLKFMHYMACHPSFINAKKVRLIVIISSTKLVIL